MTASRIRPPSLRQRATLALRPGSGALSCRSLPAERDGRASGHGCCEPRPRAAAKSHRWVRASNHLLRLIVGLAVAAHRRRARADVELFDARRDLRVLAFEQAVAR